MFKSIVLRLVISSIAFFASLSGTVEAQQAENTPISSIKTLLEGMGFDPHPLASSLTIKEGQRVMIFSVDAEGKTLFVYERFTLTPEQLKKLPLLKMLGYNDGHYVYFSTTIADNAIQYLCINQTTAMKGLSPATLRLIIDNIKQVANDQQGLMNPNTW